MATCRCSNHPPKNNRTHIYTNWVHPVGFPNTSTLCGHNGCEEAGYIYLTREEFENYQNGEDVFTFAGTTIVKVQLEKPNHGTYP